MQRLVLASTSPYRRELLGRLGIPFATAAPDVDETPLDGEAPSATALRLAREKAEALAPDFPDALIVGGDQVAELDRRPLGKPLTHANAVRQLRLCSGRTVEFHTGLYLLDAANRTAEAAVARNRVRFRQLDDDEIDRVRFTERDDGRVIGGIERDARRLLRDPGIARRAIEPVHQRACRHLPGERVLASAGAEKQDVHAG